MNEVLEEGFTLELDWNKLAKIGTTGQAILPVVVQNSDTQEVLILAYANSEALAETLSREVAVFWSTSRNELWVKGLTSGDLLDLVEVRVNCEQNSLLYLVRPRGKGSCHTKDSSGQSRSGCYYRKINPSGNLDFVG